MKIGIVSSSTRKGRKSHRVALALVNEFKKAGHEPVLIDLLEHPLSYLTERIIFLPEEEITDNMRALDQKLAATESLIFVSPEYNGGYSSALKLFVDTMDRKKFVGKAIGIASVSDGVLGGIRAALQMQQQVLALMAYPQPQMLTVPEVDKQFNEQGELINPDFEKKFISYVKAFEGFSARFVN